MTVDQVPLKSAISWLVKKFFSGIYDQWEDSSAVKCLDCFWTV